MKVSTPSSIPSPQLHTPNLKSSSSSLSSSTKKQRASFTFFETDEMPQMTPKEELTLSWLDKWRKYRKFPWKLLIHVVICILSTWTVNNI